MDRIKCVLYFLTIIILYCKLNDIDGKCQDFTEFDTRYEISEFLYYIFLYSEYRVRISHRINGSNKKIFNVVFPLLDFIIFRFVSTSMSLHVKTLTHIISASFNFEYKDIEDCTVFKCLYCKVK